MVLVIRNNKFLRESLFKEKDMSTMLRTVPAGSLFEFRGEKYRLIRLKSANALVESQVDGRNYNLRMTAMVDVIEVGSGVPVAQALPYVPRLDIAQSVRITGRGAGRYEGKVGYIAKVNSATYGVLIPNVGIVNATHGLVKAE